MAAFIRRYLDGSGANEPGQMGSSNRQLRSCGSCSRLPAAGCSCHLHERTGNSCCLSIFQLSLPFLPVFTICRALI